MNVINNTLFIEEFYLDDFEQFPQAVTDALKKRFGDSPGTINTKYELTELVKKVTLARAAELVNTEYGSQKGQSECVIIKFQDDMGMYTARLSDQGLHDSGWSILNIIIAINKAYCNLRRAEKMTKYMKALGFGLHRELSGEED